MIKRFLKHTGGNVAVIFALAALPLFLAVGAAVDAARAYRIQTMLQTAVDSAALAAGASGVPTDAEIEGLVLKYLAGNDAAAAVTNLTAVNTVVDGAGGTITVSIKGEVSTSLMRLAGMNSMTVGATAEVNTGSQALEIAMVLDNTGSMNDFGKIDDLKVAAGLLVDTLAEEAASYSKLKFGIVPFSQYVNVGLFGSATASVDVSSPGWQGCVGSRPSPGDINIHELGNYPGVDNGACPAPITPLSSDISLIRTKIAAMVADGATYIPGGILWGWNILDPAAPFTEAMTASERKKAKSQRVMVVMTDGANTVYPTYPDHAINDPQYTPNSAALTTDVNSLTSTLCENVKGDGIKVFTVALGIVADARTTAAQVDDIKTMLRNCASEPDMAFDAKDGTALKAAFLSIGKQLATLHLSR